MKEQRELKPTLQKLVHKLDDMRKPLLEIYESYKKQDDDKELKAIFSRYEEICEIVNTAVLEYMANVRHNDK